MSPQFFPFFLPLHFRPSSSGPLRFVRCFAPLFFSFQFGRFLFEYIIMKNFKTIPNYPNYAINKNGDVFNKHLKIIMKFRFDKYGYKRMNLSKHNEKKTIYIHQLVARTYLPNKNNYPCVDHINAIRDDNRLENLRWCSWVQNHWFRFWP